MKSSVATPKLSVIVPVYNAEKYLTHCVNSILAQEFESFELLLIDDGSADASATMCDEYAAKDERIRVFHQPNGGVSVARNMGLKNAKGGGFHLWIRMTQLNLNTSKTLWNTLIKLIGCRLEIKTLIWKERLLENQK